MKHVYKSLTTLITMLLLGIAPVILYAQSKITGIVNDETNLPLPGVSVLVKGSQTGASTNASGQFIITAKSTDILIFRSIGFEPKEVAVAGRSNITVQLKGISNQLGEVVVTALGIKKDSKKIGYATATVSGEELTLARDANPITGLIGKVAGLSVGPSAELLGAPNVSLRGNTISLYVVDGFPINTDTYNISPDDIESYTVLKGPAAAALYGNRASYGAILITTKKANKKDKGLAVDFNSSTSISKGFTAFPRIQHSYGPGENSFYTFVDGKGGAPGGVDGDYDIWGPYFNGQLIPQYDSPVVNGVRLGTPWTARGANNLNNFLQTGYQTNNNISISSTGENYTTRFSASQQHQQSYIPKEYLDIANFNMYAAFTPSKKWKFEANLDFNRQSTDNFPDVQYGPNSLIYNLAVWTGADWSVNSPDIKAIWQPGKEGIQSQFAEYTRYHNPWLLVNDWTRGHYKNDIYGYFSTNYKINDHLNATLRSQIDTYNILRTEDLPFSAHPYGREGNEGDYREDRRDLLDNNNELMLNYDYTVKNFINLSGVVGTNLRNFNYNSSWTSTDYLNVPEVYKFSNSKNAVQSTNFSSQMRVLSAYYSLDASFGKYATISSTGRIDKSSAFQTPTTYYYPSLSVATVISDYIKLPSSISYLKGRVSFSNIRSDATSTTIGPAPYNTISVYGGTTSGNNPLFYNPLGYGTTYSSPYNGPDYSLNSSYSVVKNYNGQTAAYGSDYLYQNGIKTSTRVNYEEGFDVKFFNNRIGFSGTAFQYIDGPRILPNVISTATGYNIEYLNALKTKKNGYEGSLTGAVLKSKNGLNWDVTVNVSSYKEVYKDLPPGQDTYQTFFKAGDRTDKLYGTAFVRTPDGKIINDAAGKPLVNPVAQYLGNENAKFAWSIANRFQFRSISLGFQFDGSVGGVITDLLHQKTLQGGSSLETVEGAFGAARYQDWLNYGKKGYNGTYVGQGVVISNGAAINYDSKTGAVLNYGDLKYSPNTQTSFVQSYVSSYYNTDEANLMSKTYAKLREVTIGFDVPKKFLKEALIKKLTMSIYGRNLLYFYKDKRFKDVDLDQYNYAAASTGLQSPTLRTYGFNLNASF